MQEEEQSQPLPSRHRAAATPILPLHRTISCRDFRPALYANVPVRPASPSYCLEDRCGAACSCAWRRAPPLCAVPRPQRTDQTLCRRLPRDAWAQPQIQEYIFQRSRPRDTTFDPPRPPSVQGKGEGAYLSKSRTQRKEALAGEQSASWPYTVGTKHICGKIVHASPAPHLFSNKTSTTTRYVTDAPRYSGDALATSDKSGKSHPWLGTSLANQRYQYHMMLSHIDLKHKPDDADPAQPADWDEKQDCTGGSKTDTLIPGSSVSNGPRWVPLPVGPLTDLGPHTLKRAASPDRFASLMGRTESFGRDSTMSNQGREVPLTGAAFVQKARAIKESERKARERRRIFEHAKRQGVEDVESWLASLDDNKEVDFEISSNRWSNTDKHDYVAVSADGLTLTPNYQGMQDCNGLVRAQQGYYSGRHYFEITLERFAVAGQGWHYIGVAGPDDVLEGVPGQMILGNSANAACLCLENCQKLRATGRPMEYGKRAVKQGDTVGVLLDLDLGELSFFLNGSDMGVAFYGMKGPLFPAVEMGMMVGQRHEYRAHFLAAPPARRKLEGPPMSDDEAFRHISQNLPKTSQKHAGQGFGSILSVPVASPFFVQSLNATVQSLRGSARSPVGSRS